MSHKPTDLVYFAAEAWNLELIVCNFNTFLCHCIRIQIFIKIGTTITRKLGVFVKGRAIQNPPIFVLFDGTRPLKVFKLNKSPLCQFFHISCKINQFERNKNYILNYTNIIISYFNEMSLNFLGLASMYADIKQEQNVILQLGSVA